MYLGIDESNHGRFPEIFVGCFSVKTQDIAEGEYSKQRSKNKAHRDLENISYKHIIFSKDQLNILNKNHPLIISVCEFAEYFNGTESLKKIFIDGSVSEYQLEKMYQGLFSINKKIKLEYGAKMDQRIKIVNWADNWANHLHRYYSGKKGTKKRKYLQHILTPQIERYQKLFF